MARQLTTRLNNNFIGGLHTESNPLRFPENTCTKLLNFKLNRDGSIVRRRGISEVEGTEILRLTNTTWNTDASAYYWEDVVSGREAVIVFVRGYIVSFWKVTSGNEPVQLPQYIDLRASAVIPFGDNVDTTSMPVLGLGAVHISSGNGTLYLSHRDINTLAVSFRNDFTDFDVRIVDRLVGDYQGLDDGFPNNLRLPNTVTPNPQKIYNLRNNGWSPDELTQFKAERGGATPANTDSPLVGRDAATGEFAPANYSWTQKSANHAREAALTLPLGIGSLAFPRSTPVEIIEGRGAGAITYPPLLSGAAPSYAQVTATGSLSPTQPATTAKVYVQSMGWENPDKPGQAITIGGFYTTFVKTSSGGGSGGTNSNTITANNGTVETSPAHGLVAGDVFEITETTRTYYEFAFSLGSLSYYRKYEERYAGMYVVGIDATIVNAQTIQVDVSPLYIGQVGAASQPPDEFVGGSLAVSAGSSGGSGDTWVSDIKIPPDIAIPGSVGYASLTHLTVLYVEPSNNESENAVLREGSFTLHPDQDMARPSVTAVYAGRLWSYTPGTGVLTYSQSISKRSRGIIERNICFQTADPTSEADAALVDTDGGILFAPEVNEVYAMHVRGSDLILLTDSGIYAVQAPDRGYFKPADHSFNRVSEITSLPEAQSSILANGSLFFCNSNGLYQLSSDQYTGALVVKAVTENTSKSWFTDRINNTNYRSTMLAHNSKENTLHILIREHNGVYIGNLDLVTGGFYPYHIPDGTDYNNTIDAMVDCPLNTSTNTLIYVGAGTSYYRLYREGIYSNPTSSDTHNSKRFQDWADTPDALEQLPYLTTGWDYGSDPARGKFGNSFFTFLKRTEQGFRDEGGNATPINPSSCTLQLKWDWDDTGAASKWSTPVEVYNHKKKLIPGSTNEDLFDDGEPVIVDRSAVRGSGHSLQIAFSTKEGMDCNILGWGYEITTEVAR